jgi:hypothetical protein
MKYKLKYLAIVFPMLMISTFCSAQKDSLNGIEALSYFKSTTQSVVITFASNIPDTSKIFRKYNLQVNFLYNKMKSTYDQYRGFMKNCILTNNSIKSVRTCLKSKSLDLKAELDSIQAIIRMAYTEEYTLNPAPHNTKRDSAIDVSAISPTLIEGLISALLDGGIKIWTQINAQNKQFKDSYLTQISSKDYDLSEYNDLITIVKKK